MKGFKTPAMIFELFWDFCLFIVAMGTTVLLTLAVIRDSLPDYDKGMVDAFLIYLGLMVFLFLLGAIFIGFMRVMIANAEDED